MSPSPSPAIQLALPYTEILAKRNTLPMQCTKNILSRCLCGNDFIQIRSAEDNWRNKLESLFELESKSAKENLKISHPFLSTGAVSIMPLLSSSKLANYRSSSSTFFRRRHAINKEVTNTR
jgi:hypothetical protein